MIVLIFFRNSSYLELYIIVVQFFVARGCPHVSKSINFSAMKKGLGKQAFGECAVSKHLHIYSKYFGHFIYLPYLS